MNWTAIFTGVLAGIAIVGGIVGCMKYIVDHGLMKLQLAMTDKFVTKEECEKKREECCKKG